jgi:dUTPase
VIDNSYEGECILALRYSPDCRGMCQDLVIKFGDPLGQLIPYRLQEMCVQKISNNEYDEMCEKRGAQRKDGGFGSTSK